MGLGGISMWQLLLLFWIIPALLVGWYAREKANLRGGDWKNARAVPNW